MSRDRRILGIALPALGALAAEPLYVLVDAAIVGNIGTAQLAGLAIAGGIISSAVWLLNFLTYATTARVARLTGAGLRGEADHLAGQAMWLALALGAALMLFLLAAGRPLIAVMGGTGEVADQAWTYLWISALGVPFVLVALAGQGYLRGVQEMRRPLVILGVANIANAAVEIPLVFVFGMGIAGSAVSTVAAQLGAALAFVPSLTRALRAPAWSAMRGLLHMGGHLVVRTGALLLAFLLATAVLARAGAAQVAAHEVAFRCFIFLALVLDAIAIAAQTLVGTALGAGDVHDAHALARRMVLWGAVAGAAAGVVLLAGASAVPGVFSDDPAVLGQAERIWWVFALMQPANAVVFVLDGVLIGAGDTAYLMWSMLGALGVFAPWAVLVHADGWGITGIWAGLCMVIAVRLGTNVARLVGGRWAVAGAGGA